RICALSRQAGVMSDDVVAVLPSGVLWLNLNKDVYEQLGLAGRPLKLPTKEVRYGEMTNENDSQRQPLAMAIRPLIANLSTIFLASYLPSVVEIDFKGDGFKTGSKYLERVKWAFTHVLTYSLELDVALNIDDPGELDFPSDSSPQKMNINPTTQTHENLNVPSPSHFNIAHFGAGEDGEAKRVQILELIEWIGMVSCISPRISASDRVDPFVAVYAAPDPSELGNVQCTTWEGCLGVGFIEDVLIELQQKIVTEKMPWGAMIVWSSQDAPNTTKNVKDAGQDTDLFGWRGDYVITVSREGTCMLMQLS
ncbi:Ribonuclease P protein subunit p40, partial [Quaeritorhiza haematococci]